MARRAEKRPLAKAKTAIKRAAKKITTRLHRNSAAAPAPVAAPRPKAAKARPKRAAQKAARPARRKPDIPLDVLNRTYTPRQTSLKASFRASGDERQRDQELAGGFADERWNDEDRITNKSGDPRIGTHHRKYEPGE